MNKGKTSLRLIGRYLTLIVLTVYAHSSMAQLLWAEDFGTAAACGDIDSVISYTSANGNWSETYANPNDTINAWFVSAREAFTGLGNCGDGCTAAGGLNQTLHVSTNSVVIDPGATYDNTNVSDIIAWTPPINTGGAEHMILEFDYLEGGDATDNGTVVISVGTTAAYTTLLDPAKTTGACGVSGQWQHATIYLDTNYNNQFQLYIGFRFESNGDGIGSQPSFAVDNITITDTFPEAVFTISNDSICAGETVNFTNLSTSENMTFLWEFDGTNTSTAKSPQNVLFATAGTYVITLTATNGNGSDDTTMTLEVLNCVPPIPAISANSTNLCVGQCVNFTDQSIPGTFGIGAWNWQFQGGSPNISNAQNPSTICYTTPGLYDVTLTVTDIVTGLDSMVIFNDFINVGNCAVPTVTFTSNITEVCNNDFVEFYAETTGSPDSIRWFFEGGNPAVFTDFMSSANDTISVFYSTPGTYNVKVVVWNGAGEAIDSIINYITVNDCPTPIAAFTSNDRVICPGTVVVFQDNSQFASEWFWEFPGGQPSTSNDQFPGDILYANPGVYPVTLIAKNVNGEDTLIAEEYITVDSCLPPDPRFEVERDSICRSTCVQFFNTSIRTDSTYFIFWWHPYPDSITGTAADTIDPTTPGYEWMVDDSLFNDTFFVVWKDYFPAMPRITNEDDPIFCFDDSGSIGIQVFAYNEYDVSILNLQDVPLLNIGGSYPELKVGPDKTVRIDNIDSRFYLEDTVSFETTGTASYFSWFPEEGLSCYDCPRPTIYPTETRKYYVTNFDDYGCQAYDSLIVYVEESYFAGIPNIFSPNGDDNNDILWTRGNGIANEGYVIRIWNRYGEMVFESYSQNNGWDGTYKSAPAPGGSYNYYVKVTFLDGTVEELTGNVTLLRY
jgi:gliding motility-associated-like protein